MGLPELYPGVLQWSAGESILVRDFANATSRLNHNAKLIIMTMQGHTKTTKGFHRDPINYRTQ